MAPLANSLLDNTPTGKYSAEKDLEAGPASTACCAQRGTISAWKCGVVAGVQLVAWTWILVVFAPGITKRGGSQPDAAAVPAAALLHVRGFDGSVVQLTHAGPSSSGSGGDLVFNLWSDKQHLVNARAGPLQQAGSVALALKAVSIRHAAGPAVLITPAASQGVRLEVDGIELAPGGVGGSYGAGAFAEFNAAGLRLRVDAAADGQSLGHATVESTSSPGGGVRLAVRPSEDGSGLVLALDVSPPAAAELSAQEAPEGLLGRTLRGAGAPNLSAAVEPATVAEEQLQQQQQAAPSMDEAAAYAVNDIFEPHAPTNRFAVATATDDGGL